MSPALTSAVERLDPLEAPLAGITLIEASAGTGKTYTITGLYLRLVLEMDLRVDRILVVTYTIAATEELRDRIRRRLVELLEALRRGGSEDAFLQALVERAADRDEAVRRVDRALRGFDEAAIFTIHGFCQRVLADSAFESGMPFETEIVADPRETLQEIVDDFWRRELDRATPGFIEYVFDKRLPGREELSPERLCDELLPLLGKPDLEVRGAASPGDLAELEARLLETYGPARELWRTTRDEVAEIVRRSAALNRARYRPAWIDGWIEDLERALEPASPQVAALERCKHLRKFTASEIRGSTKKGKVPPRSAFFERCEELCDAAEALASAYGSALVDFRRRLLSYASTELPSRNRRERVQSFDDLLVNLLRALRAPRAGAAVAASVRERYRAALIDEFQDTDPVQYEIFRRVFGVDGAPVFLVGDPKQAIYSFRGADIFAYLAARRDSDRRYTLDVNWRSQPGLIGAVNTLFGRSENPFLFEGIPYPPAEPAREGEPLLVDGEPLVPLRLFRVPEHESKKPWDVKEAEEACARGTAAEITRLLRLGSEGRALLGDRPVEGGDVAVLVRTHWQGRAVRDALLRLGVPSVQHLQDDVFASPEAAELERVLHAVVEPGSERCVRAALASDLIGLGGQELHALSEDERAWVEWIERFHELHGLWRDHGFVRMFRTLLRTLSVPERLLDFRDGERRLTNLLHLEELLQAHARPRAVGMEGLLEWLSERRQTDRALAEDDDRLLRLESDEHLVKIVTMHRSKGLEYPIVFCPFLWSGTLRTRRAEVLLFHEEDRIVADLGSPDWEENRERALFEERAENQRLLYVALTRARSHTTFAWGSIRSSAYSAPAELIHAGRERKGAVLPELAIDEDLASLVRESKGSIGVQTLPRPSDERFLAGGDDGAELAARPFEGTVRPGWRITSFSSLVAGHAPELPDRDAEPPADGVPADPLPDAEPARGAPGGAGAIPTDIGAPEAAGPEAQERTIFTFPGGTRAGTCLHHVFERLDFGAGRAEVDRLVERTLVESGFAADWAPVVAGMVERVLDAPLAAGPAGEMRLRGVAFDRRVCELDFQYPLRRASLAGLGDLLAKHGVAREGPLRERMGSLVLSPARGSMKGFIDLVFEEGGRYYLVDYKSNRLGQDVAAYDARRVEEAMEREAYVLQYLIYTVALHRFLGLRLPDYDYDRHVGGVYYLFLRGIATGPPGHGVFRDRPARELVEALDAFVDGRGS